MQNSVEVKRIKCEHEKKKKKNSRQNSFLRFKNKV